MPELVFNGEGSAVRDFAQVADTATAFLLRPGSVRAGSWRAYNVGSGHPSSVQEAIATAEAVTAGRPARRRHATAAHEPVALWADCTRIRSELGWRPEKSSLPEIISAAWTALNGG